MDKIAGRLTVFFEEPFGIGVFERISEGKLSVCKITFGAEPKDYEIYDFVLKNYYRLKFSLAVATDGSCSQSETGTAGSAETGAEHRDMHKIAIGFEITAGAVEN